MAAAMTPPELIKNASYSATGFARGGEWTAGRVTGGQGKAQAVVRMGLGYLYFSVCFGLTP